MTPRTPRSIRLSEQLEAPLAALLARSGKSFSALAEEAFRQYLDTQAITGEADLIDNLSHDFVAMTLTLRTADGKLAVEVSDVERRTTDPLGRRYNATTAELTQFVGVEARRDPDGWAAIELVGLAGTKDADTRVLVATVPAQPDVTVTVRVLDLHPLARDDAEHEAQ